MSCNNFVTRGRALAWYIERDGFRVLPIGANSKKAKRAGFGAEHPDFSVPSHEFSDDDWVAILCGPCPAGGGVEGDQWLLCIDIDGTAPAGLWPAELGEELPPTLTSKDRHHLWYWVPKCAARERMQQWRRLLEWQGGAVDLCWAGGYAIEKGQWDERGDGTEPRWDPSAIATLPERLVERLVQLGTASQELPDLPSALAALARWWPRPRTQGGKGGCHDAALALGGILARNGVSADAAVSALAAAGGAGSGGFWSLTRTDDRTADVLSSIEALGRGVQPYGWPNLRLVGPERTVRACKARVERYLRKLRPEWKPPIPGQTTENSDGAAPSATAAAPEPTGPVAGDYVHVASWPPHRRQGAIIDILARRDTAYALGEALVEIDAGDTAARMLTPAALGRVIGYGPERCWALTKDGTAYKIGSPPLPDCTDIVAMRRAPQWWAARGVRPLLGVSHCPFLARSGNVVQAGGYHAESGWYLIAGDLAGVTVPDAPTHADAQAALAQLLAPWGDFPWANTESMLVPVAALLAALARPAISGPTPLHVFNAPTPGSGKTLAADLVGRVVTGSGLRPLTWPTSEEERGKTLSAIAISGARPFVLIDNVGRGRSLGGDALERVLTASDGVEFRILGRSEAVLAPWTTVMLATGNGVSVPDDMVRRTLMARLEPDSRARSESGGADGAQWTCGPDVREWVLAHRTELLSAALTLLRAHVVAGRPAGPSVLKGFESWSSVVAHALWWASGVDVTGAAPDAADDETGAALDALVGCMPLGKDAAVDFRRLQDMGRESGGDGAGLALRVAVQEFATAVGLQTTSLSELTAVQWGRLMGGWVGDPRPTGTLRRHRTERGMVWWRDPPRAD